MVRGGAAARAPEPVKPQEARARLIRRCRGAAALLLGAPLCASAALLGLELLRAAAPVLAPGLASLSEPVAAAAAGVLLAVLLRAPCLAVAAAAVLAGAGQLGAGAALHMVLGASAGGAVTSMLVPMDQPGGRVAMQMAFASSTMRDVVSILTVLFFLPVEVLVGAIHGEGGPLFLLSRVVAEHIVPAGGWAPIQTPMRLFADIIISAEAEAGSEESRVIRGGLVAGAGDAAGCAIALVLAGLFLAGGFSALRCLLRAWVFGRARAAVAKAAERSGCATVLVATAAAAAVQTDAVATTALAQRCMFGQLPLETVLQAAVGARLGMLPTPLVAILVSPCRATVQIAAVHVAVALFGAFLGLLAWALPLKVGSDLGLYAAHYRLAPMAYVFTAFVTLPAVALGVSALFSVSTAGGAALSALLIVALLAFQFWWIRLGGCYRVLSKEAREEDLSVLRSAA